MGVGDIGKTIASDLISLRCKDIHGLVFSPREDGDISYHTSLKSFLQSGCDYIINVLPSTSSTVGLLNGDALSVLSDHPPIFINVGRGDVINESSLLEALEKRWIGGAVLDVFESEPLPEKSRLWEIPSVVITPHVSGVSNAEQASMQFVKNLNRYLGKMPLLYEVDWT
eukprot:CAMPEP_0171481636 /NCGR_PEP_ID=MMETSP0946-20130122/6900_1 /TAXON_ID=109269 /ORGANISM="Vaucheria litorea, Strain CCMP2940" /LENGTH=168 /DNA_ID=CAMNT_0012013319 /DNA_START=432 /DNA_END=934 /DNA_ORIENTATION=-